jgi:hypothetical protein
MPCWLLCQGTLPTWCRLLLIPQPLARSQQLWRRPARQVPWRKVLPSCFRCGSCGEEPQRQKPSNLPLIEQPGFEQHKKADPCCMLCKLHPNKHWFVSTVSWQKQPNCSRWAPRIFSLQAHRSLKPKPCTRCWQLNSQATWTCGYQTQAAVGECLQGLTIARPSAPFVGHSTELHGHAPGLENLMDAI